MARVLNAKASTDAYVDSPIVQFDGYAILTFRLKNHGTASISYKIIAGHDDNNVTHELKGETVLAASGSDVETLTMPFRFFKVSIKSYAPSTPSTVSAWVDDGETNQ
jgi:hypothetical protein